MAREDVLGGLVRALDEHDCLLIADALDSIDPDDQRDTERAAALADAFRRAHESAPQETDPLTA